MTKILFSVSAFILILIGNMASFAELTNPLGEPTVNQECFDKINSQEQTQNAPIDKDHALYLVRNYPSFQVVTTGHNYTFNRVSHEFDIDSSTCTAHLRDVMVEFLEKTPDGDSLITIREDLGLAKVITLDVAKVNNIPVTYENTHYMTPVEPSNYGGLIFGIIITAGITTGVLFFFLKKRKRK